MCFKGACVTFSRMRFPRFPVANTSNMQISHMQISQHKSSRYTAQRLACSSVGKDSLSLLRKDSCESCFLTFANSSASLSSWITASSWVSSSSWS